MPLDLQCEQKLNLIKEDALSAIVESIAKEEAALVDLIKSENEKLKYAIENMKPCNDDLNLLLRLNESIDRVAESIAMAELILKSKLQLVLKHLKEREYSSACKCHEKSCAPPKPCYKCSAHFIAITEYCWFPGRTLRLWEDLSHADNNSCGLKVESKQGDNFILLPPGKDFRIEIDMKLQTLVCEPVVVELLQESDGEEIYNKRYGFAEDAVEPEIRDVIDFKHNKGFAGLISFRLTCEKEVRIKRAVLKFSAVERAYI